MESIAVENNEFTQITHEISNLVELSVENYYDIFTYLLSSTTWQSPKELAIKLILQVAPTQWQSIQESPNDSIETRRKKEAIRKGVLVYTSLTIANLGRQKSLLQRFTSRLLVRETLARSLHTHDQDRIITAELMTSFHKWKGLLSALSTHDILTDERNLIGSPIFYIDGSGKDTCTLTVNGHIDPIDSIPDLPIIHDTLGVPIQFGPIFILMKLSISNIQLPESVIIRHENDINPHDKINTIRAMVLASFGEVPAYKKISIGDQTAKSEPKGNWQLQGI